MTARPHRSNRPRSADFTTPLTVPGGAVAGADLVRELPPEVALAAWQGLRSVLMWATEEPAMRGGLFEPCAMAEWERELLEDSWEPDVRCPLAVLVRELTDPVRAAPETLAHGCLCITEWALEHRHTATALAFAEAAALAWPQHPRWSWMAGRLMRAHGRPREAEMWLKRAVSAATTAGDWEARTLALNALGNSYYETGNYRQAAGVHRQALRIARKHGLRERQGEILHDLFVATWYMGEHSEAENHARAALEIYKSGHPRLATLAHDVAFSWVAEGYYSRALSVLQDLAAYFDDPRERIRVLASTARAAGGCGNAVSFSETADEIWAMAEQLEAGPGVGAALVELARGATSLERWDVAERALSRAIEVGRVRSESDVLAEAEEALASVRAHQSAAPARNKLDSVSVSRLDGLVSGFVTSLREGTAPAAA